MTLRDAILVKVGDKLKHNHIKDCFATATAPVELLGDGKWYIPIAGVETTSWIAGLNGRRQYVIDGRQGYCWSRVIQ
jgi:hypothetical protein